MEADGVGLVCPLLDEAIVCALPLDLDPDFSKECPLWEVGGRLGWQHRVLGAGRQGKGVGAVDEDLGVPRVEGAEDVGEGVDLGKGELEVDPGLVAGPVPVGVGCFALDHEGETGLWVGGGPYPPPVFLQWRPEVEWHDEAFRFLGGGRCPYGREVAEGKVKDVLSVTEDVAVDPCLAVLGGEKVAVHPGNVLDLVHALFSQKDVSLGEAVVAHVAVDDPGGFSNLAVKGSQEDVVAYGAFLGLDAPDESEAAPVDREVERVLPRVFRHVSWDF